MIVKCFGCTAIHNKALYKCIIHSFIHEPQKIKSAELFWCLNNRLSLTFSVFGKKIWKIHFQAGPTNVHATNILRFMILSIDFVLVNVSSLYISVWIHKHIIIHGGFLICSDVPETKQEAQECFGTVCVSASSMSLVKEICTLAFLTNIISAVQTVSPLVHALLTLHSTCQQRPLKQHSVWSIIYIR